MWLNLVSHSAHSSERRMICFFIYTPVLLSGCWWLEERGGKGKGSLTYVWVSKDLYSFFFSFRLFWHWLDRPHAFYRKRKTNTRSLMQHVCKTFFFGEGEWGIFGGPFFLVLACFFYSFSVSSFLVYPQPLAAWILVWKFKSSYFHSQDILFALSNSVSSSTPNSNSESFFLLVNGHGRRVGMGW